ncbi:motA/TolQ/ExbB proton channel family protein [Candidatus Omnitrophus magneticus]|uniref:MotA/TolQ/ExbB proton channel family protein n=1 Tax=Candidatus Omnitrophus magneticus TaxID=1609969 RepID=A0A0F0CPC7_9BACT|nr:motA/TolQ/ExbB proton channel family protein [Candidatus Omnitrophus magneticus]
MKYIKYFFLLLVIVIANCCIFSNTLMADAAKYASSIPSKETSMTLWQIIKSGGELMIVLGILSIIALGLIIYYFFAFRIKKLLPGDALEKITGFIETKDFLSAKKFCERNTSLIADISLAGLQKLGHDKIVIEEAIEDKGRRSITVLWQKLSYLADIAAIAPMVGLLGTIIGMIQAFNYIVFEIGAVKPILLAGGVSKAMVTTAAGLIIAIPVMIFYAYFRGVLQNITIQYEHISTELFQLISEKNDDDPRI